MSSTLLTILVAIGVVAFFVIGLSITLMVKGRHIQTDVGNNDEMKKRGLVCASKEMRQEDEALRRSKKKQEFMKGGDSCDPNCDSDSHNCGTCGTL